MFNRLGLKVFVVSLLLFAGCGVANADEFVSTDFKVLDPVMAPGGSSTSTGFSLIGAITQIAIGTSTSNDFGLRGGFLYFPAPTVAAAGGVTPTVTVTDSGVTLGMLAQFIPTLPAAIKEAIFASADLDKDGRVGLKDLSILLYYMPDRPSPLADLNRDKKVDTFDLSILFSRWTESLLTFASEDDASPLSKYKSFATKPTENFTFKAPQEQVASLGVLSAEKVLPAQPKEAKTTPGIISRVKGFFVGLFESIRNFFKNF